MGSNGRADYLSLDTDSLRNMERFFLLMLLHAL